MKKAKLGQLNPKPQRVVDLIVAETYLYRIQTSNTNVGKPGCCLFFIFLLLLKVIASGYFGVVLE